MKKSIVIAQCLIRNRAVDSLEEGERVVQRLFASEFSVLDYNDWNGEVSEERAHAVSCITADASTLNVRQLIRDLM